MSSELPLDQPATEEQPETETPTAPAAVVVATPVATTELEREQQTFELRQREAKALSAASMLPTAYRNNIPDCMIANDMAKRMGLSGFVVLQNLHIIQGKPSWASTFVISLINTSGQFKSNLRFRWIGEKGEDSWGCVAWAIDHDGEKVEGPPITWGMAVAEGWTTKGGSKWKTMPEQMFPYRAAAFFGRLYVPERMNGMLSTDEVIDITGEAELQPPMSLDSIMEGGATAVPREES